MSDCSRCEKPTRRNGRYCRECHAEYMRGWRKTHPMSPEQRKKGSARAYAREYLKRGKIVRRGCEVCGARAQMHHDDYDKPLEVRWLCRPHHLAHHQAEKRRLPAAA